MMPTQIGRYQVVSHLGEGGMAQVFLAYDPDFRRQVAIKLLSQSLSGDTQIRKKFQAEAHLIASLEHHAIVPMYDFGDYEGKPYLVMRLMSGGTLEHRLQNGRLPLNQIDLILDRICSALDKAHTKQIVHRDIKPANILFDDANMPYLADFGIARLTDATQTMTVIGTPYYMAPEQAQGRALDGRTDVYQMGAVLFQMFTGTIPFQADNPTAILFQHVHTPVPQLRLYDPNLPAQYQSVVEWAMSKDTEKRPHTPGTLYNAFKQAQQGVPPQQHPSVPVNKANKQASPASTPNKKNQNLWLIGAGLASAVVLLLIIFLLIGQPSNIAITPTPTPPPVAGTVQNFTLPSGDNVEMVFIPAGDFVMGSESEGAIENEAPQHSAFVQSFWIDRTEVTNAQFAAFVDNTNYVTTAEQRGTAIVLVEAQWREVANANWRQPLGITSTITGRSTYPVVQVSWYDATAFCAWRNGTLPTEAEWEKAARGTDARAYPWGNQFSGTKLNYCDANCVRVWADQSVNDGYEWLAPIGSYSPSGDTQYGIYDMAGNVWEWTKSVDRGYPFDSSTEHNPTNPSPNVDMIVRGGSWNSTPEDARVSARTPSQPEARSINFGFRCAVVVP